MSLSAGSGGVYKSTPTLYVGSGTTWKHVSDGYVGAGGSWKRVFGGTPTGPSFSGTITPSDAGGGYYGFSYGSLGGIAPDNVLSDGTLLITCIDSTSTTTCWIGLSGTHPQNFVSSFTVGGVTLLTAAATALTQDGVSTTWTFGGSLWGLAPGVGVGVVVTP